MAMDDDASLQVLRDIYQAIQGTNSRLDETNGRLGTLENRMEALENRVEEGFREQTRRQTETEMRVATELISVAKLLREKIDDHHRVNNLETRVAVLEIKAS